MVFPSKTKSSTSKSSSKTATEVAAPIKASSSKASAKIKASKADVEETMKVTDPTLTPTDETLASTTPEKKKVHHRPGTKARQNVRAHKTRTTMNMRWRPFTRLCRNICQEILDDLPPISIKEYKARELLAAEAVATAETKDGETVPADGEDAKADKPASTLRIKPVALRQLMVATEEVARSLLRDTIRATAAENLSSLLKRKLRLVMHIRRDNFNIPNIMRDERETRARFLKRKEKEMSDRRKKKAKAASLKAAANGLGTSRATSRKA